MGGAESVAIQPRTTLSGLVASRDGRPYDTSLTLVTLNGFTP